MYVFFFFFFSSRRRHTRYIGDWRSQLDDLHGKNDGMARENKNLSERLREAEGALKDATRSVIRNFLLTHATNRSFLFGHIL